MSSIPTITVEGANSGFIQKENLEQIFNLIIDQVNGKVVVASGHNLDIQSFCEVVSKAIQTLDPNESEEKKKSIHIHFHHCIFNEIFIPQADEITFDRSSKVQQLVVEKCNKIEIDTCTNVTSNSSENHLQINHLTGKTRKRERTELMSSSKSSSSSSSSLLLLNTKEDEDKDLIQFFPSPISKQFPIYPIH